MIEWISLLLAFGAIVISGLTAWLTLFRRGTIKMTQPTVIYFGPDASTNASDEPLPKIFLRTLLFATSKRGRVVESIYASLSRNETIQNFNIWVYGDERLSRGSGLFVGETGLTANHHFLTPDDGSNYQFISGQYRLTIYAKLLGDRKKRSLFETNLTIDKEDAEKLDNPNCGLYFDWGSDSERYIPHTENKPAELGFEEFVDSLKASTRKQ